MIIAFDKGQFILTNDEAKSVHISLDGTMTSYTGRTVKRMPNGFRKSAIEDAVYELSGIESVLWCLCRDKYRHDYEIASKMERLWNANTLHKCLNVTGSRNGWFNFGEARDMFRDLTFKQLLKAIREYEKTVDTYTFSDLASWYFIHELLGTANAQELMNYYREDDLQYVFGWHKDNCNKVAKMLMDDDVYDMYCAFGSCDTMRMIDNVIKLANELGVEYPTKNVLHAFANLTREAENMRNRRKDETLAANQNPAWAYEGNGFVVIVPTTMRELVAEGQAQHNCVGDYWTRAYGNDLEKGKQNRGVVFIRHADRPEASYITCDFNLETKCINQYLATYNESVQDEDAKAFRREYQEYLRSC